MSREKEIIAALAELSTANKRKIGLSSIESWVRENSPQPITEHWGVTARQVLRTLTEVGFVEPGARQEIVVTDAFLDSAPARGARAKLQTNDQQPGTSDGRRDRPPGNNDPNEPGDASGGGYREVLAHPFLFAVSDKDFEQLLDAI